MIKRYFSIKNLRLPFLLAGLLLLVIVGPALSAQVTLLSDDFENTVTPFAKWDGNGATNWSIANNASHSPTHSARANHGSNFLASDNLDASDALSIGVDFWFRKTDLTSDSFLLYYCYGLTCNQAAVLDPVGPDDTWLNYTDTITDTQYFKSNFYIRFVGPPPPGERIFVDDVLITKDTGETLTVSKTGNGSGTVTSTPAGINCGTDCTQGYAFNTQVTLTAVAAAGSTFTGWSGSGCSGTGNCVVSMDAAKSVTAEFTLREFTLTVNITGNGSVAKVPDQATYHYGDVVQLTATPATGWSFVGWSGDLTGSTNPANITMDGNKTVSATFELNVVSLTINQSTGGTITADPAGPYHYGDDVELTATADSGHSFTGWTGNLTGTTNPATLHMDGNKTVSATFELNVVTLTINQAPGGTITADPAGPYHFGDDVTLTATPARGYAFTGWTGDLTGTTNPATLNLDENKTVSATFTRTTYYIFLPILAK